MKRKFHVRFGKRDEGNNARRLASCALVSTSRDPNPSPEDVALTRQLVKAGHLLDIEVTDHIVIGKGKFVSLKERGLGFD